MNGEEKLECITRISQFLRETERGLVKEHILTTYAETNVNSWTRIYIARAAKVDVCNVGDELSALSEDILKERILVDLGMKGDYIRINPRLASCPRLDSYLIALCERMDKKQLAA